MFGADGTFEGRWGGRGDGPGELRRVDNLAVVAGDSLIARNDGLFRQEVFGPDGRYARTVMAPPQTWRASGGQVAGWLPDGSFVVGPPAVQGAEIVPGRQLLEGEWHRFDPSGEYLGVIATLPERFAPAAPASGTASRPRSSSVTWVPGAWTASSVAPGLPSR